MDENRGNNRGGNNNNGRRNGQNMLWFVIATVVVLLLVTMITNGIGSLTNQEITYSEFQKMVKNNQVKSVVITNSEIQIQPVEDKTVTPWESVMPEVSDSTERRELPKAGLVTGVKS